MVRDIERLSDPKLLGMSDCRKLKDPENLIYVGIAFSIAL